MMESVVIDASYLIEFLDNPLSEKFQWILDSRLLAPDLLRYEYNDVLLNKCKSDSKADQFRDVIRSLQLEYYDIIGNEEKIYELATEHKLSFYDASYLFLAVDKKMPIVTYDSKILQAVKVIGLLSR